MATKTATPSRRRAAAPASRLQIVVRRGSDRRFASLKEQTSDLPVVVTWDRRTADRRRVAGDEHHIDGVPTARAHLGAGHGGMGAGVGLVPLGEA
mgnify:CR=1 FL=1